MSNTNTSNTNSSNASTVQDRANTIRERLYSKEKGNTNTPTVTVTLPTVTENTVTETTKVTIPVENKTTVNTPTVTSNTTIGTTANTPTVTTSPVNKTTTNTNTNTNTPVVTGGTVGKLRSSFLELDNQSNTTTTTNKSTNTGNRAPLTRKNTWTINTPEVSVTTTPTVTSTPVNKTTTTTNTNINTNTTPVTKTTTNTNTNTPVVTGGTVGKLRSSFLENQNNNITNTNNTNRPVNTNNTKPWNKREVVQQELDQQENEARTELATTMLRNQRPTGFQQASFPFTPKASEELNKLKDGQVNWVQLSLDDKLSNLEFVISKTISENQISSNIETSKPQFYLFKENDSLLLIYFYPEKEGTSIKNRMVYSTCKASLADQIRDIGFPNIKKFDARVIEDFQNLREETSRTSSSAFRPTEQMITPKTNQEDPYERNSNPRSRFLGNGPVYGSAFRVLTAGRGGALPKGVVLPPPGAYC